MKQVIQNYKTGELSVMDVPIPDHHVGSVLVQNQFSLISAGTERSTVKVAQASLIGKARQRPDLVKQVLKNLKKEGFSATFEKVKTKIDSSSALGYSSAGVVLSSLDTNGRFLPGQRVACAGQNYASHAEVVNIPQNLIAHIPDNVTFEEASFTTLGAIALQGVRQANPTLGENICVIGLGLLGQITCQLLQANGCAVFGVDMNQTMVDLANETKVATAVHRESATLDVQMQTATRGYGFDKVIITAAAPSNDPIVLATEVLRKKGQIILVGAVPIHVPRDPYFYRNELELKISCSYGPGRYDPAYEEEGHDYPIGYVRWTEQRNMEAFLELLSKKRLDMKPLISHTFDIDQAQDAYAIVEGKKRVPHIGMLFKYSSEKLDIHCPAPLNEKNLKSEHGGGLQVSFIGAGSFAQSYLIPSAKKAGKLCTIVTSTGISAESTRKKFDFVNCSTNSEDIFSNQRTNAVFIATRHDTHAKYIIKSLEAKKAVFVEKPLCLNKEELAEIKEVYNRSETPKLMVGYNRRFAPISEYAKKTFGDLSCPLVINYRVNAGYIPRDHWTQTASGGGRILGEVCHFVDWIHFLTGARTTGVYAKSISTTDTETVCADNIAITLSLDDGSLAQILYLSNGAKSQSKERIEIFGGGASFVIDDFDKGYLYTNNKSKEIKLKGKGHSQEVDKFCAYVINNEDEPIPFEDICHTSEVTFSVMDALSTGITQKLF